MESTKPAALASFGSLSRTVTKAFRLRRTVTSNAVGSGIPLDQDINVHKLKQNLSFPGVISDRGTSDNVKQDKKQHRVSQDEAMDSLLSSLFASITAIKASYCQLQHAQIPYNPDRIQSADLAIVTELKRISDIKQTYLKSQRSMPQVSESQAALVVQVNELRNLAKTFRSTTSKLEADLESKRLEILALEFKLVESEEQNGALEAKIHPRRSLATLEDLHLSCLNPTHFLVLLRYTFKCIRSFVNLMTKEMESAGWDLDAAAGAILPEVLQKSEHRQYAFESYVCQKMFSGFHLKNFDVATLEKCSSWEAQKFFKEFTELKSVDLKLNLSRHSPVAVEFYRAKYPSVVHPKMEPSFFGDLQYRETVSSGDTFPDLPLFTEFLNMAKSVWLLHCLFFSFEPESNQSVFQVRPGSSFSEVYMECICTDDGDTSSCIIGSRPLTVGFTVVPGFRLGRTVIQSKVYLTSAGSKSKPQNVGPTRD